MRMVIIACCLLFGTCLMLGLFFTFCITGKRKRTEGPSSQHHRAAGGKPWSSLLPLKGSLICRTGRSRTRPGRHRLWMTCAWSNAMANGQFDEASGGIRIGQSALV